MHQVGFVYVLTNPLYVPGLVKIGETGLLAERSCSRLESRRPSPWNIVQPHQRL